MSLQRQQLVFYRREGLDNLCRALGSLTVGVKHATGSGKLETAYLHEIVDDTYLLNVLVGLLTHSLTVGLWTQMGKLGLPVAKGTLVE